MRHLAPLLLATSLSLLVACGGDKAADAPAAAPASAPEAQPAAAPSATEAEPAPEADSAPETPVTPTTGAMSLQASSTLGFVARKNDEVDVAGSFTKLEGQLTVPGGDLSKATGTLTISWVSGIDSGDPARDASLTTVFFGAFDDTTPKGQVALNSLEVETPRLEVGQSTSGNAFVDVGAGMAMMGLAVPVSITRDAADTYTVTLPEGSEVSIDKLGMGERKATLMKVCNHKSLGDAVKIAGTFVFGS
jgi:hypothetical protein